MGVRLKVNETFFDIWSPDMAYVLGFFYADGNIQHSPAIRGKYIRVTNTDRDRIEIIKQLMDAEHSVVCLPQGLKQQKQRFGLSIGNQKIYDRLIEIGMTPNKSLTMLFPQLPQHCISAFVRGYFDGDGCICIAYSLSEKSRSIKRMRTIFTCGSSQFLAALKDLLDIYAGMDQSYFHEHTKKGAYQLRYSTKQSIRLFKFMYQTPLSKGLYLARKYAIFMQYFRARPRWVDPEVQHILQKVR